AACPQPRHAREKALALALSGGLARSLRRGDVGVARCRCRIGASRVAARLIEQCAERVVGGSRAGRPWVQVLFEACLVRIWPCPRCARLVSSRGCPLDDRSGHVAQGRVASGIEGTLEPELMFELARRNGVRLPYADTNAVS